METYVKIEYTWTSMNQKDYVWNSFILYKNVVSEMTEKSDKRKYFWRKR